MLDIFTVLEVDPGRRVVLEMSAPGALRVFGRLAVTYGVTPVPGGSGLRGDIHLQPPAGRASALHQLALAWGDVPMMRKQLLTWKSLAEGRR